MRASDSERERAGACGNGRLREPTETTAAAPPQDDAKLHVRTFPESDHANAAPGTAASSAAMSEGSRDST